MNTHALSNDYLELEYLTDSLRIIGLTPKGKTNLLANLSHLSPIPTRYGDFHFRGGHRLWHAPESMPRTYAPDTGPLTITDLDNGVILETQTEPGTGIRKRIEIRLTTDTPSVTLVHTLINDGLWTVELAPWAITQFRLGGIVILPLPTENVDPAGLLPNRQLSFWSYASLSDPRLVLRDGYTFFRAESASAFKMGYFNLHGWLAYWLDGVLFKKTFSVRKNAHHPDNNSNAEMYCNEDFVELESLTPFTQLSPGASIEHVEIWEIFDNLDIIPDAVNLNSKLAAWENFYNYDRPHMSHDGKTPYEVMRSLLE